MSDKVSIIVPIYNVEKYLPKCIESIINQTYKNLEIILVDDGSPDNCAKICDEYAKKDNRIKVIHKPNGGVSSARNAGLDIATGEYIGFVDPDDFIAPEMYEQMLEAIKTANADLAICGFNVVHENDFSILKSNTLPIKKLIGVENCIFDLFSLEGFSIRPCVWNKLFVNKLISNQRFDTNYSISEDLLFFIHYLLKINNIIYVTSPLYNQTNRSTSVTHNSQKVEDIRKTVIADKKAYDLIRNSYPSTKETVLNWIIQDNIGWYRIVSKTANKKKLNLMKNSMLKLRVTALFNKKTYWKTRIIYFFGLF